MPWETDYPWKGRLGRGKAVKGKGKEPLCLGRTFSSFPPRELEVVARSAKKGLLP